MHALRHRRRTDGERAGEWGWGRRLNLLHFATATGQPLAAFFAEGWAAYTGSIQWKDVPPLEPSVRLVGESVIDQTFGLLVALATGVPPPEQIRRANADLYRMREFLDRGGWLAAPGEFHDTPSAPSEWTLRDEVAWVGATRTTYQHLEFESGYKPHFGDPSGREWLSREGNHREHAYVLEHPGEPRPWLVCVHGFSMGAPTVNFVGFDVTRLHHELGLNLIFPCLPLHGPRSEGAVSGGDLLQPDYASVLHTFAQGVWDVRRTIAWLRARGAENIGLYGLSMGGHNVSIVAGLEPDLDCVIAGIPAVDFPSLARDNQPYVYERVSKELEVPWETVRAIAHVVSPLSFQPLVPRERRFIYAGTADRVARPIHARSLWRHWDRPEILWFAGGHVLAVVNAETREFVEMAVRSSGLA